MDNKELVSKINAGITLNIQNGCSEQQIRQMLGCTTLKDYEKLKKGVVKKNQVPAVCTYLKIPFSAFSGSFNK